MGLNQMVFHRGSSAVEAIEKQFKILNKLAGKPFSNINKFTPADIWLIGKVDVASDMKKISSLEDLRNYFKHHFNAGNIIGVSLKKIDKEQVPWAIYNDGEVTPAKFTNIEISTSNKLFRDSMDVYMNFEYNGSGRCQFRSFSGKASGWQGEIKGKTSAGGKIGGGVVQAMSKKYLKQELTSPGDVTKMVKSMDDKFIERFWFLIEESGVYNTPKEEFLKKVKSIDEKYIYSKFLGLELNYILRNSTSSQCDTFVRELIGYASSNTSDSAIFIKLGK